MVLKFAHLADYAAADVSGKLTIVGQFGIVYDQLKARPIQFPPFYIVAAFQAHVTEGTEHQVRIHFVNSDGQPVMAPFEGPLKFAPSGKGKPLQAHLIVGFGLGFSVPDLGDYEFRFVVDGRDVGELSVAVVEPTR
jgi:uncharacterized protein DUF6941